MRPWIFLVLFFWGDVSAQRAGDIPSDFKAAWIGCPGVPAKAYGVYHFRKTFTLSAAPGRFLIHVSADNRYRLWVNGHFVCAGPARSDLAHWYFETVDIGPLLQPGDNVIAALVWNMGEYAPVAQVSNQTGFLLQGALVNTNSSWRVFHDTAYAPLPVDLHSYYVVGPGDHVRGDAYPWGWEQPGFSDSGWSHASYVDHAFLFGSGTDNRWTLEPRNIPLFPETLQRIPSVRRGGLSGFLQGTPTTIPPSSHVSLLLDQTYNTVAYPSLLVSGGRGATIRMSYAEALFDSAGRKGNRNDIEGKKLTGNADLFEPDGGPHRLFRPLWFRTYRYVQLDITTGADSLVIDDLYGMRTGYPFEAKASFSCNDSSLSDIWRVGWRTALMCAGENYFDCPYYEQLQYEGDTRIQSLISLYVTGDDRLMRKAILDFYHSRIPEGLTQGRYPSNRLQVIPPFSLYWVSMVYDYWMHRGDSAFIEPLLLPIQEVLHWYAGHVDSLDMLGPMNWWSFVDWDDQFPGGVPDGATNGHSSVVTLQYAYTLNQAAALFADFGMPALASQYRSLAHRLCAGTYRSCFDASRGLMANTPSRTTFSQHASIMGVLSGALPGSVMRRVLSDTGISQTTFYYRFYLTRALKVAGLGDLYYSQLGPWRDMLARGLTTFAEKPDPTRSDCHAWSASPNYDFLATICGIVPAAPGFSQVLIQPCMGPLTEVRGSMPVPAGMVSVHLLRHGEHVTGNVELPSGVKGRFVWKGRVVSLQGGRQEISL
ncbi:alpha-L-rhamnosidase-related protein [Dinghuibacter silviterrae]|uniref:Alpha-L-rhamnosidase-like protein n=1 Tax=Dinghuibacter silviterrae TaxID=1539049 RepID=A0A4R8DJ24_9BACT|nr:alpha-L-rhamnosidase C-terminal domain-containing protein [Dinghuibacter silviterrae]TDW97518.1 alpha-L-rhamnosidase-like protein [Dinghuibacter silviterrae]